MKVSPVPFILAWVGGFLLFSWLFKWQSTGSRLQLPWFVLAGLPAGWLADHVTGLWDSSGRTQRTLPAGWLTVAAALLLWSSLTVLLTNLSRPLLPRGEDGASLFNRTRLEWLFANSPEVAEGYVSLAGALLETDCREIGLLIDSSAPEYPLWVLLSARDPGSTVSQDLRLEHLQAGTALRAYIDSSFHPCAVICIGCSSEKVPPGYFLMSQHPAGLRLYYIQR